MTIIVPELSPSADQSTASFALPTHQPTKPVSHDKDNENNNQSDNQQSQPLYQSTSLKSALKTTSKSISLVISKTSVAKETDSDDNNDIECGDNGSSLPGSGAKVVSRGRRRSVDKQYRPSQPTGNNNGGGRTSARRSGRSYQNYDNNSSNGNSGADGNGEDNDDSDDDEDDEYIDEDDDDEEEEEEEEEEEDEEKNEDGDDEEDKSNGVDNSIDEKLLATFGLKVPGDSTVDVANVDYNGPIPTGTPITLQGIVCHETLGGVLVVNIKWRDKIYCGSLMDCTRHSWARPRFQSNDGTTHTGKTRLSQGIGRGKGKGQGKRLRSNSVTSTISNVSNTVSPLKQKLRGRKKTISGSSADKRQGFRSSKRKPKNDDDSDDSLRPGKRSCTVKGAPSPQPSPTLIECPEPGCEKKYKHINGLRYHQAHAHLESKNQDDDNNSDDRSSTTPSPSEEFKEPDPLTTSKGRTSNVTTRSFSDSSSVATFSSSEKDSTNSDSKPNENNENTLPTDNKDLDDTKTSGTKEEVMVTEETMEKLTDDKEEKFEEKETKTEPVKQDDKEDVTNVSEFIVVADKSTGTSSVTTATYPCTKHSVITMTTVVPANEVPEVADTQEVWETVLDSGCVTTAVVSDDKKLLVGEKDDDQDGSKEIKDEGPQVLITTSSINQLGIEVEDISENEEDIDPGQDIEFNSREEMEKAVENLQSSSYVTSLSTENNLQMLSSLKDPSLIFGLTNRERLLDDKDGSDTVETDPTLETIAVRQHETIAETTKDVTSTVTLPVSCSMSIESLVSRSITASKHEPPLTNADTPSSRFKIFPCRNYGDDAYSVTNVANINTITTLSLIRDPGLIKTESAANNPDVITPSTNSKSDKTIELTKPSYTGLSGFSQDCTTTSIHSHGPKEKLKELQSTNGDILSITTLSSERQGSGRLLSSYTSPKSSTVSTFNTVLNTSPSVSPSVSRDSKSSTISSVSTDHSKSKNYNKNESESMEEDKKDEADKSSVSFVRQSTGLMPKHNRPSVPSLPVGVAHPYQYGSMVTSSAGLSTSSHTDLSQTEPSPTTSTTTTTSKSDDLESRIPPKDKPVGEVGPVNVKRPAIHAGLPTVIPVGAPGLKTQSSLHVPIRQGLKPPGLEDRALTPNSLRLAASSPRSNTTSPLPTSPRLSPKIPITEPKPSKLVASTSSLTTKPTNSDTDTVVIVKQENEPATTKVNRDAEREKKTSPYEKEQLTPEQIQLYQLHHRQMMLAQASMDPLRYAYMARNFGYDMPWSMSPEQMKMIQQQQRLRAAEEERMEAVKRSKEASNKAKLEKRESRSPMTSTPPRLERVMRDLSPGEGSRSVTATSEASSRGMPCLEPPPEKKAKLEVSKGDETDRELQKLRHKKQEEYLSKQSMQHKFTMFKQLENAGGAAKTHSIPLLTENKDDYQKATKYPSTSTHSETSHQSLDKSRKPTITNDPDESSQLDLASRSRDPRDLRDSRDTGRDLHSKAKMRERGSFVPTQFQEYLKHSQMIEHSAAATGSPLLIPGHLEPSYVTSRMKDRESSSPYKSPSPRPPRPRSPTSSHRTSPYKTDRSSSQSISPHRLSRPSYSEVYSSSPSRSSVFGRADKSPPQQTDRHKDMYAISSSSTSTSRPVITEAPQQSSRADETKHASYRGQDRLKEESLRPGIISNNLAVRRGDVTATMLMQGHGHAEEELLRRHPYVMYSPYGRTIMDPRQQQHAEQVYAMMSSAQQNAARAEQYFSKRQ